MKKFLFSVVLICTLPCVSNASVENYSGLQGLSRQLTSVSNRLSHEARVAIGPRPTYQQKNAFERAYSLYRSAYQFEKVVFAPSTDDHQKVINAYHKLRHDVYYARASFRDLFWPMMGPVNIGDMENMLRRCEYLVRDIYYHLY
jgi:hypothetical protein